MSTADDFVVVNVIYRQGLVSISEEQEIQDMHLWYSSVQCFEVTTCLSLQLFLLK